MNDVKPRPYHAPQRAAQALATRTRIVAAARALFRERGYGATTMPAIALGANVSVQSVYATFGAKRSILEAIALSVTDEADLPRLIAELGATPDPRRQLAAAVDFQARLWARGADVPEIVRGAAASDPALAAVYREGEHRRRAEQTGIIRIWAETGALRPGLGGDHAADTLWTLSSPDVHRLLVAQSGWTGERYRRWLYEMLAAALFGDAPQPQAEG